MSINQYIHILSQNPGKKNINDKVYTQFRALLKPLGSSQHHRIGRFQGELGFHDAEGR